MTSRFPCGHYFFEVIKLKNQKSINALTECAILVAMSVVLSLIKLWQMPLGGGVTPVSMLPVCLVSYRHGMKWGFAASFIDSLFQLLFGITMSGLLGWGLNPQMLVGCILFDYIIAYTVLGVCGIFRKKGMVGIVAGLFIAIFLRFVSHFLSGYIIFTNLEQWDLFGSTFENAPVLYSICYNGMYLLPEFILTAIVVIILAKVPATRKKLFSK